MNQAAAEQPPLVHVYVVLGFVAALLAAALYCLVWDLARANRLRKADAKALETAKQLVKNFKGPADFCARLSSSFEATTILGGVSREIMGAAWGGSHVSAEWGDRIERDFEDRAIVTRTIANLAVYVGLLGTLVGLIAVVVNLNSIPTIASPQDLKNFGNSIRNMFGSFGWAFGSAVGGILVTVVLSACLNAYDKKSAHLAQQIESFAIQYILPASYKAQETGAPASNQEIARQLIEDMRQVMREAHANLGPVSKEMADTATSLKEAAASSHKLTELALEGATIFVEGSGKLSQASEALGSLRADLGFNIGKITEEVGKFQQFVQGWDPEAIRDATRSIASAVPDMELALGRIVDRMEGRSAETLQKITEALTDTKLLVRQQTDLVGRYEEILSQLPAAIAAGGHAAPAPAVGPDMSEVVEALRRIQGELAVQKTVTVPAVATGSGDQPPVTIQPIPASVVSNLEAIAGTLRRIESSLSVTRAPMARPVLIDPPLHQNGDGAVRKSWWKRLIRR